MRTILILSLVTSAATCARAGNAVFNFVDMTTQPQAVRSLSLYPVGGPFTNGVGGIVTRDRVSVTTGTNGMVTVSNVYGWTYRSELQGTWGTTTNYYTFPVTNGTFNAADYAGSPTNGPGLSYSSAQSDSNYVRKAGSTMTGALVNGSSGGFVGNGIGLTNLQASKVTGTFNQLAWMTNVMDRRYSILAFGAVCDGEILTNCSITSGSSTLTVVGGCPSGTNITNADVGKYITIYGAGSSGQNLLTTISGVSGSTVTLAATAGGTVSGYCAMYCTDDSAAWQLALAAVSTNGPGHIVVPNGAELQKPYRISGIMNQLQDTGTNSLHHNAQIYFPEVPRKGAFCPVVSIEGADINWIRGLSSIPTNEFMVYGACVWSGLPGGPDVNPGRVLDVRNFNTYAAKGFCNGTTETIPLNNITVAVRNLTWRSAFDNNLASLDLSGSDNCVIENVTVDTGWHHGMGIPPLTKTNGWGLKQSGSFNENLVVANNVLVRGFYNGFDIGENASIPNVTVEGCVNGLCKSPLSGSAGAWIGHANVQECSNVVYFPGNTCAAILTIEKLEIYSLQKYTNTLNLVFDPQGAFYGSLKYSFSGANGAYTANGTLVPAALPIVGSPAASIRRTILSSPVKDWSDTTIVGNNANSLFYRKIFGFGDGQGSEISWGTNTASFATTPEWKSYVSGSQNSWNLEHSRISTTPFSIDGADNVSFNVPGKTVSTTGTWSGNGSSLTSLNASSVSSGTLADARLSGNVLTNTYPNAATLGGNLTVNGSVISTNLPRLKRQLAVREIIGADGFTLGAYNADPFMRDSMYHAASASWDLAFEIPSWASTMTVTFYASADSARAWTNRFFQEVYDTGIRAFGGTDVSFPVVTTSTTPVWQSNFMNITITGKTNSAMILRYYNVASNATSSYYMQGPVTVNFQ